MTWIPVTERLPEETGQYIVCTKKGYVYCTIFHGGYFGAKGSTHVAYWMPLPEAPERSGAE